ncbi:MAG: S-methyl-5'-thioadenosine phosphorylase [Phycisphaera sp.]|nr:S-methyl-5'-thioadenosine phosphorylase [Phycisphaera sp.]
MSDRPIRIGLIGGTGLGEKLGAEAGEAHDIDTPFGKPSSPIVTTKWNGVDIAILQRHGLGHVHSPTMVPYRANIFALKSLGVSHIVASGATGSLREDIKPRDLVVVDQIIDKTLKRPNTFYEHAAVHVEFAEPFCPVMRKWLIDAKRRALTNKTTDLVDFASVHEAGTYVCMEGPAFSTRAESEMHRRWGGDLIGMTAMPEARLAREAEIAYALVALPTDYDCWRPHAPGVDQQALLDEIIGNVKVATDHAINLIRFALTDLHILEDSPSPAHDALRLAIWSDKSKIPADEVTRLSVLWGRHFQ